MSATTGSPPLVGDLIPGIGTNGGRLSPSSMAMMSTQLQMQQLLQSHVLTPSQLQSILQQQLLHQHKVCQTIFLHSLFINLCGGF
jgi:hypothetical protein